MWLLGKKRSRDWDVPGEPRLHTPNSGGLGLIPAQEANSPMLHPRLKIPYDAVKTWCNQINRCKKKKQTRRESEDNSKSLIPTSGEIAQSRLPRTEVISVVLIYEASMCLSVSSLHTCNFYLFPRRFSQACSEQ